jgi:tRNA threonylcarbamoyl adenosine modification protein YeaZ
VRVLALDTGSALASVAVAFDDTVALRTAPQRESSGPLLGLIEACLGEAGLELSDLDALAVLAGPGSFTGLRVGLATVLGLHQATGIPAGALPTLPVLATAADGDRVVAAVDALRGDWFVQSFGAGAADPLDDPRLRPLDELRTAPPATWVGFGLTSTMGLPGRVAEPPPLAPLLARFVARLRPDLDPTTLTRPLYLREPALSAPKPPKRVGNP